jgi:hypothetical protein
MKVAHLQAVLAEALNFAVSAQRRNRKDRDLAKLRELLENPEVFRPMGTPLLPVAKRSKLRKQGLEISLRDGRLSMSIGVETLAFCGVYASAEQSDEMHPTFLVTNPDVFAADVKHVLLSEKENGDNPVSELLDEAMEKAVNDGCAGVVLASEDKKIAKACKAWDARKVSGQI